MRRESIWALLLIAASLAGCAGRQEPFAAKQKNAPSEPGAPTPVIVTPATGNRGRIASVNLTARHVVVSFPIGIALPVPDQKLSVYRAGLKVAELKVSKERIDVNVVADITTGECAVNDEVRTE
jgi:hypothetical protein